MEFGISSLKSVLNKLPKFDNKDNLALIIINGIAFLFSIINSNIVEKNFLKLGSEVAILTIYLISSLFIFKQKYPGNLNPYRILCISSLTLMTIIDINHFHLFHIIFIFFLSLAFKNYIEILSYAILSFFIFILKLESSTLDKFIISFFSFLTLIALLIALKERKFVKAYKNSKKKGGGEVDKEIMIINEATKLAALTEMSNGVAHEINNPLTIIAGIIQIMEMKMENKKLTDNDLKNLLETVTSATERASHVVRSLEEFSRDGSKDPFQIISLRTLCVDSIDIFKERFNKLDIKIKTENLKTIIKK